MGQEYVVWGGFSDLQSPVLPLAGRGSHLCSLGMGGQTICQQVPRNINNTMLYYSVKLDLYYIMSCTFLTLTINVLYYSCMICDFSIVIHFNINNECYALIVDPTAQYEIRCTLTTLVYNSTSVPNFNMTIQL